MWQNGNKPLFLRQMLNALTGFADVPATAISSIRNDADTHIARTAACDRNFGEVRMPPVILCSPAGDLFLSQSPSLSPTLQYLAR